MEKAWGRWGLDRSAPSAPWTFQQGPQVDSLQGSGGVPCRVRGTMGTESPDLPEEEALRQLWPLAAQWVKAYGSRASGSLGEGNLDLCTGCPASENPKCRTEETYPWGEASLWPPELQPLCSRELFSVWRGGGRFLREPSPSPSPSYDKEAL